MQGHKKRSDLTSSCGGRANLLKTTNVDVTVPPQEESGDHHQSHVGSSCGHHRLHCTEIHGNPSKGCWDISVRYSLDGDCKECRVQHVSLLHCLVCSLLGRLLVENLLWFFFLNPCVTVTQIQIFISWHMRTLWKEIWPFAMKCLNKPYMGFKSEPGLNFFTLTETMIFFLSFFIWVHTVHIYTRVLKY